MNAIDMKGKTQAVEMDMQGLTEGCTHAIVSYSLDEDYTSPNGFKTRKIVVFFDGNCFCPETVNKSINEIMIRHNQSFVKSHLFMFKLGTWVKTRIDQFKAVIMRDILGIIPNNDILDWRGKYNNYRDGRA